MTSEKRSGKIKKRAIPNEIQLSKTQDILKEMGKRKKDYQRLVGFSVETEHEEASSLQKLKEKNLDFIIVNNPLKKGAAFGHDTNQCVILGKEGFRLETPLMSKQELAKKIISLLAD